MNFKFKINKVLESGLWWQLLVFVIVSFAVFLICFVVYLLLPEPTTEPCSNIGMWQAIRLFVDSNSIIDKTEFTQHAVVLLFIECMGTILFTGLIVAIITNVMNQNIKDIKTGKVHYKFKEHIVIIGYDKIVPSIISELIKHSQYSNSKIVLQISSPIDELRNDLLSKLPEKVLKQVIFEYAPRLSVEELELLHTEYAKEVFIVGDRMQDDHDAENMFTFETLVEIHEKKGVTERKPITIWFENEASYTALQLNDISPKWKEYFEFKPYNFYKRWANRLLTNSDYGVGDKRIIYPELDHDGIKESTSKYVHLIIVGMNRMGIAIAKETAHLMHFPNYNERTGENRTRITFIDDNADVEKDFFIGRHRGYFDIAPILYSDMTNSSDTDFPNEKQNSEKNFLDVQFEFIKGRIDDLTPKSWTD